MRLAILAGLAAASALAEIRVSAKEGVRGIERARDAMRRSGRADTIVVAKGDYPLTQSLEFDSRDPAGAVIKAEPGARLTGGVRVRDWRPVRDPSIRVRLPEAARSHVVWASVPALGAFQARGFGREHLPAHSELFFEGKRMTVARWPDREFTRIAEPLDAAPEDDGHGRKIGRLPFGFRYAGERPARWKSTADVWVHGYWSWDWADTYERVASIDTAARAVVTAPPHGIYGFRKDQRYYFLNVLEELDQPGEYWLDFAGGKVYFWPPSDARRAEAFLSTIDAPLIRVNGARDLRIEGFALEAGRGHGIRVDGGSGVTLHGLKIRNMGNTGVIISGGRNHAAQRSEIAFTGDSAIELTGGDRATLEPAGHRVEDCDIHHMGEWVRTYNPAVKVNGAGNRVANNAIHDAPHAGIILTGNDHVIERNDIHHLALETGDVGAIYIGRDYTERGTVIRHNYIHELGGVGLGSMAVYLDDCASGITVFGNVFHKVKYAAFVGGGRDNRVENNVFVECDPAIHLDARGLDQRKVWQDMVYQMMKPRVEAMRVTEGVYADRYPSLRSVLPYLAKPGGVPPEGNVIRRNLIQGRGLAIREPAKPFAIDVGDNVTVDDPGFFTPSTGAFRVPAGVAFEPIPVGEIGIRK